MFPTVQSTACKHARTEQFPQVCLNRYYDEIRPEQIAVTSKESLTQRIPVPKM